MNNEINEDVEICDLIAQALESTNPIKISMSANEEMFEWVFPGADDNANVEVTAYIPQYRDPVLKVILNHIRLTVWAGRYCIDVSRNDEDFIKIREAAANAVLRYDLEEVRKRETAERNRRLVALEVTRRALKLQPKPTTDTRKITLEAEPIKASA